MDHKIVLKEGVSVVNVKPYWYGFHQKDEIERLVTEMLKRRMVVGASVSTIGPSTNQLFQTSILFP